MSQITDKLTATLSSPVFFQVVLGLFVLQAGWIALSAAYPMAFDEAYHFETTQLYAEQWSPFLNEYPEEAEGLAAVHRYPSYLFHYLLSFPLRIIEIFTMNEFTQILILRLLNIGIVAGGLILWRRLFIKTGVSAALTHIGLFFFTLIPIVPLLSAHINYDNLLLLLIPGVMLLTWQIFQRLSKQQLPIQSLLMLGTLLLISSVVKYAMLPIIAAIGASILLYGAWQFKNTGWNAAVAAAATGWRSMKSGVSLLLILAVLISGGLAFERYGVNLLEYSALVPACDDVIAYEECLEFGPFERSQGYMADRDPDFQPSRLEHTKTWFGGMWYRLLFMINGDVPVDRYQNFPPLPLMAVGFSVIFLMGIAAMIRYWRPVFSGKPFHMMLLATTVFYGLVLLQMNYNSYTETGRIAAVNGRYLLLVLPLLLIPISRAVSCLFAYKQTLKTTAVITALLLLIQGGGLASFLVRSGPTWYWPHPTVQEINQTAGDKLSPLIYGSDDTHLEFVPR